MLLRPAALALMLAAGLGACAPQNTNTTFTSGSIGVAAQVRYGTIVGMMPVQIQNPNTGTGAVVGSIAGGAIGSTIGGDWRARTLAGVGGALVGGLVGAGAESAMGRGAAVQFTIRPDGGGPDYTVVQSNELGLQVGERVAVSFGDRARLQRVAGGPAPYGAAPQGYAAPAAARKY